MPRKPKDDEIFCEGTVPYDEAGVTFDELRADGFFDSVTDEHRRKAAVYVAKHASREPAQMDLFA